MARIIFMVSVSRIYIGGVGGDSNYLPPAFGLAWQGLPRACRAETLSIFVHSYRALSIDVELVCSQFCSHI
jgi:hypothetical protein